MAAAGVVDRGFRHAPPAVLPNWIERVRLQQRLARRFELEVLLVAAPAGYGKTSSLARALAKNEADPAGTDLWLQCSPHDSDAAVLAPAILRSAGLEPPEGDWAGDAGSLADALLRFAPDPVCLVLDDLHVIGTESTGMALLADLADRLPSHAHLLLAGRTVAPLRLARKRLEGRCEQLGLSDFEFDDEELDLATGGTLSSEIARWPAMTALGRADLPDASVDYLLEEVGSSLGPDRLAALTALSYLREVDDELASAAAGTVTQAADLLADLPLVLRSPTGSFQMHDLWRQALARDDTLRGAEARALSRVAQVSAERGRYVLAAEQFLHAGDTEGVRRTALAFASQPLMFAAAVDLRAMAKLTGRALPGEPLARLLAATVPLTGDELTSAAAFQGAAEIAREAGAEDVETIALQNVLNLHAVMDSTQMPAWLVDRVKVLADSGNARVLALDALLDSMSSRHGNDSESSARSIGRLNPQASPFEQVLYAFGMSDLGRPEQVADAAPDDVAAGDASRAGGQYLAQAYWLRGDVDPELALALGSELAEDTDVRGVAHVRISTDAVLALVALAAGEVVRARWFTNRALGLISQTASPTVRAFAMLADAATAMHEQDENEGRLRLEAMLDTMPMRQWPARPYLYALPLLQVLVPETAPVLAQCRFGPAITAARDAGAALLAARQQGDVRPALDLPWHRPWLLRAHVLPPHLVELAAVAASVGQHDAEELIGHLPNRREYLLQVGSRSDHLAAEWATASAAQLPARPAHDVRVELLGPIRCLRGTTTVTDQAWVRRDRVRQLLTLLLLHQRVERRRIAETLWPDLATEKAVANLRVNLSHLQRVLEPGRAGDERPWFIRSDGEFLEIHQEGLEVDSLQFEEACRRARSLDDTGQGTRAIDLYRAAAQLYRGDYGGDWPDIEWLEVERLRLRTLAMAALTRLGELLLARGEPEEASEWAAKVIRAEPLDERAHRMFARSLAAQGNRQGAGAAIAGFIERLGAEGLSVESETTRLAASFSLHVAG